MKMKLMGTKEVKNFDLTKHQELVGGFAKAEGDKEQAEEVSPEEPAQQEV